MRRCFTVAALALCLQPLLLAQDQAADTPRPISVRVVPAYPELAHRLNLEGIVKLRVTVRPDGTPNRTEVLGGNPVLAKAAQDAVVRWKWTPAPHDTTELIELRFHPK
ncbi:MAG TPA: energy transducer TonB [Candidatus Sulfotelmatobacter sp.]|nr:energy transducer TonB [Candidatus Sulfotelmatobacter sp.]